MIGILLLMLRCKISMEGEEKREYKVGSKEWGRYRIMWSNQQMEECVENLRIMMNKNDIGFVMEWEDLCLYPVIYACIDELLYLTT